MDESPAAGFQRVINRLAARWQKRFDAFGEKFAKYFATETEKRSDYQLREMLKSSGIVVPVSRSREENDVLRAVIAENVSLIKSIPEKHFTDITGDVMRSVARGGDLAQLTDKLEAAYGVTRRRAANIARDQNNKATAVLRSAQEQAIGITEGVWRHSHGGKHPRPEHVAADGKRFRLDKGLYLEGVWTLPGEMCGCRCSWTVIIPGLED